MKCFAILAIAFAATVSASIDCEHSDNILCAKGMGYCNDPNAHCAKRSVGHSFTANVRDVIDSIKAEPKSE